MTFTASVQPGAGSVEEGSVTFTDGGNPLGTVAASGGIVRFTTMLAPGAHTIAAVYSGGPDLTGSHSASIPVAVSSPLTGTVTPQVTIQIAAAVARGANEELHPVGDHYRQRGPGESWAR